MNFRRLLIAYCDFCILNLIRLRHKVTMAEGWAVLRKKDKLDRLIGRGEIRVNEFYSRWNAEHGKEVN